MRRRLGKRGLRKGMLVQAHLERLADAKALFRAGRWAGAVYLAGYAIECLLKAALLSRLGITFLPEKYWHHDLDRLTTEGRLDRELKASTHSQIGSSLALLRRVWDVTMRYRSAPLKMAEARKTLEGVEVLRRWLLERI